MIKLKKAPGFFG